jgi:hypothetical protein
MTTRETTIGRASGGLALEAAPRPSPVLSVLGSPRFSPCRMIRTRLGNLLSLMSVLLCKPRSPSRSCLLLKHASSAERRYCSSVISETSALSRHRTKSAGRVKDRGNHYDNSPAHRLRPRAVNNIPPVIWWNNLERVLLAVDDLGCRRPARPRTAAVMQSPVCTPSGPESALPLRSRQPGGQARLGASIRLARLTEGRASPPSA